MVKRRPVSDNTPGEKTEEKVQPEQPKVQESKEPEIQGSKTVKAQPDKKIDQVLKVDFMADNFSSQFASKTTKENTEKTKSNLDLDKKVSDVRDDVKRAEGDRSGDKFTVKDIHQIATFIIGAFDGGISVLLNFLAKDNSTGAYTMEVETKRQLADQLTLILVKYQVKFKIEFMFLITLILAYMGPVGGMIKRRRKATEIKASKSSQEKQVEKRVDYDKKEEVKSEVVKEEVKTDDNVGNGKVPRTKSKRRNSRQKAWHDNN